MKKKVIWFLAAFLLSGVTVVSGAEASTVSGNDPEPESMEGGQVPEYPEVQCLEPESVQTGGTRYLFLGDSTSCGYLDGYGNEIKSYVHFFQSARNADVTNAAIGGATFSSRYQYNIAYELDGVDLSSYDVVFFQFGINDFVRAYPTGDVYSKDKATLCGAFNCAVERIKNAGADCYCILPFYYKGQYTKIINENGDTFDKYLTSIKNLCIKNNITVVDFNQAFGINSANFWDYYIDSVHPGGALQQQAGEYLDNFMKKYDDHTQITAFVERLYHLCLERSPDEAGLNDWRTALIERTKSGAVVAEGFFFSEELQNRGLSDGDFVELLYLVMMDRESDEEGKAYWIKRLDAGVSREGVFKGFAESAEFDNICASYGISRGTVSVSQGRDRNTGLTMFVSRLYTTALDRAYDSDGLNDWCNRILDGAWSVSDAATTGFFDSQEFLDRNLDDEAYIQTLYRTFLDREYDEAGLEYWMERLSSGIMTRDQVLKGFSDSEEFTKMMKEYGL